MKLKSIYIYPAILIVGLALIIIFSNGEESVHNNEPNGSVEKVPDDEVHKSLISNGSNPSGENVMASIKTKLDELGSYVDENPADTAKMREYANLLFSAHNSEKAKEYYKKILKVDPNRDDILFDLSVVHFNSNEFQEAKTTILRLLEIDKNNEEAIYNLGVVEARLGDVASARKQWEDLLTNHPNSKMSKIAKESLEKLSSSNK